MRDLEIEWWVEKSARVRKSFGVRTAPASEGGRYKGGVRRVVIHFSRD